MSSLTRLAVVGGMVLWLLCDCATPPKPFDYQPSNELKPGPGIFTGEEGAYSIYGPPPVEEKQSVPAEEISAKPVAQ